MLAVKHDVEGSIDTEHDIEYKLAGKGGKMGGRWNEGFERKQQR